MTKRKTKDERAAERWGKGRVVLVPEDEWRRYRAIESAVFNITMRWHVEGCPKFCAAWEYAIPVRRGTMCRCQRDALLKAAGITEGNANVER